MHYRAPRGGPHCGTGRANRQHLTDMKLRTQTLITTTLAALLCSCASTSLQQTWKAPDYQGAPQGKIGIIGVDERLVVRQTVEGHFAAQFNAVGQPATRTWELMSLGEIKADHQAAAARLKAEGVDAVLIVRLVDVATRTREVRESPGAFVPTITGFDTYPWYNYYSVAFVDMGIVRGSVSQEVYLESTLFSLTLGKRLFSGLTRTVLKDDVDRVEELKKLAGTVVKAMKKESVGR